MSDKPKDRAKWRLFKSSAAMTLAIDEAHYEERERFMALIPGSIFLEFAPAKGPKEYDWSREAKKTFKIGVGDIAQIFSATAESKDWNIWHNPEVNDPNNDKSRQQILKFTQNSKGGNNYGYLAIVHTASKTEVSIGLTYGEYSILVELLKIAIPKIIGL